jgi:hypothetical protein
MRESLWLFIVVGKAALITTLALALGGLEIVATHGEEQNLAATMVFLPTAIAVWWMFRALQAYCTRREARAVATTFAMFSPVSLFTAMLVGEFSGGYADQLLGSPFGLVGAYVGIVAMTTFVSFVLCLLTLRVTRRIVKLEATPI